MAVDFKLPPFLLLYRLILRLYTCSLNEPASNPYSYRFIISPFYLMLYSLSETHFLSIIAVTLRGMVSGWFECDGITGFLKNREKMV